MSATFNHQPVIAGQKIGVSPLFAILLWFIAIGLTAMNVYHVDNFLVSKLTDSHSSYVFIFVLHIIAVSAALLEIPLAKSVVTNYRLHGFNFNVLLQSVFTLIIASMAVIGGINSQLSDASKRDTQIQSYESSLHSFESQKQSLLSARSAHRLQAKSMSDRNSRAIEKARADQDYYSALARLEKSKAGHQLSRPTRAVETGSTLHWVTISLFSLVCSFGVIFVSGFMSVYYQSLVSLPAFSLMSKANHAWSSSGEDFVTSKHEISPLNNKLKGFAKVEKSANKTTPPSAKNSDYEAPHNYPTSNRPHVDDTHSGAVSEGEKSVSVRTLNSDPQKGAKIEYSESHYEHIKKGVIDGSVKATIRGIKSELLAQQIKFIDDAERQQKAGDILARLSSDRVIIDNPDFGGSGRMVAKYLPNPDHGAGAVTCKCPECGALEKVEQVSKSGKVRSVCGAVYIASENIA